MIEASAQAIGPAGTSLGRSSLIPAKILVADDDPRNLLALEQILEAPGYELVSVLSGEEALRQVLRDDFAVILLDVQMPTMDGYEVANLIRSRPRSSHVPIIFLTAYNKDELHVFRGYTAGAVDYVFKPIEPIVLQSKVGVFVELYRKTEEIRRQSEYERNLLLENLRVRGEKLAAEQALRREQERQQAILRSLPVALTSRTLDPPFPPVFVSDNIERITGFPSERFVSDPAFGASRIHPEDRDQVFRALGGALQAGHYSCEYRWQCADGTYRNFLDQGVLAPAQDDVEPEIFGTMFDVTERRMLEERLLHGSKLEAIGQLTGGIAHDFNNMLSVVMGSLDLLQNTLGDNELGRKRVRMAMEGAQRCADLTNRLLSFARRQPLRASAVDLEVFGRELVEILRRTLGDNIDIRLDAAEGLWPVQVDPSQLEAALVNLAVNSRDAMPDGGRISIRFENVGHGAPELPGGVEGDAVLIQVADTGSGMSPEVRDRVFEPFFTTKEIGRGTGLGLSMTYGFVKQSGGEIEIRSAPGEGTTVRLFLPRLRDGAETALVSDAGGDTPGGHGEIILVVEDDVEVRSVVLSTLQMLGYFTLAAENGEAALALLKRHSDVRLVLSDINMPGAIDGFDLAREVQARWQHVKVLLTSGFVDGEGDEAEQRAVLLKPYRADELARKLRDLIDQRGQEDLAISA
jgi:PAS domain S-box-containing protein